MCKYCIGDFTSYSEADIPCEVFEAYAREYADSIIKHRVVNEREYWKEKGYGERDQYLSETED